MRMFAATEEYDWPRWFDHVSRSSGLAVSENWKTILKTGMDFDISTRATENRTRWKGVVVKSSVMPQRHGKVMG